MKLKKLSLTLIIIAGLVIAWYLISPFFNVIEANEKSPIEKDMQEQMEEMKEVTIEKSEDMPAQASILAEAEFKPEAHEVEGKALLITDKEKKILRFEDFNTVNGPELHIYLAADLKANDYIDLGIIKATKGNVNYEIDKTIDTDKYNKVLVWCEPFGVLFSYAELDEDKL